MEIYKDEYIGLTLPAEQVNSLNLTSDSLRGFFSRTDLIKLLNTDGCFGVRFYNVKPRNQAGFLVAECVRQDGFGVPSSTYLRSNDADNPIRDGQSSVEGTQENMVIEIFGGRSSSPKDEHFASFFKKTVLLEMLAQNGFRGICFYTIPMHVVNHTLLPDSFDHTDKLTHLAIATNIIDNVIDGVSNNLTHTNNFSDRPCPGHCVNKNEAGEFVAAETPLISDRNDLDGPYIPSWN